MVHYPYNRAFWPICDPNLKTVSCSEKVNEVECVACLRKLASQLEISLDHVQGKYDTLNSGYHNLANDALWAGTSLRNLYTKQKDLHEKCPYDHRDTDIKCLVDPDWTCWVRNYEAVMENRKNRKR